MASGADDRFEGPVSVDLLADLQAGLLDDLTAARLRQRARTDPEVGGRLAALDRVRQDVAALGTNAASAGEVPAEVSARIGAALRSAPPPRGPRWHRVAAATGIFAAVAAGAVGTAMVFSGGHDGAPARAPTATPLSRDRIDALLHQPADLDELADPRRRASCLSGLGYPGSTDVLGGMPTQLGGTSAVLMLLPGDAPGRITVVTVARQCSAADARLLDSRVVDIP